VRSSCFGLACHGSALPDRAAQHERVELGNVAPPPFALSDVEGPSMTDPTGFHGNIESGWRVAMVNL